MHSNVMQLLIPVLLLVLHACAAQESNITSLINNFNASSDKNYCEDYGYLCENGATCMKTNGLYSCKCAPGFNGLLCNGRIGGTVCSRYKMCRNSAACEAVGETKFRCNCPKGFSGVYCQIDDDDCADNPCTRGTCIDRVGNFTCKCPGGWQGWKCDVDINECSSSPCHTDAICTNTDGSYSCACKPGFYGNGTVCYENTLLPVTNATKLTANDFNQYSVSNRSIETELPFIIGTEESSVVRISKDGYLTFSDPPYQLRYPTYYRYLVKPMVFPYWSYHYGFANANSAVHYELLDNENHADYDNLRKVGEIVSECNSTGAAFQPESALIVTWTKMEPYSWYNRYGCYYCNYYYKQRGQQWAERYCKYCVDREEHLTFQAIVTRNATHSFAIFNYGQFKLQRWRWWYYYTVAGYTDGHTRMERLPFSNYWWRPRDSSTDNHRAGNCQGKLGRHLLVLATELPPSKKLQCRNWLKEDRKHKVLDRRLKCDNCPRDMRQAVLDWRYWPYEYSCDKRGASSKGRYRLTMCFRGRYQCIQNFKDYTCNWRWSWWCRWERCQFFHAPRCCYKMNINWKRDGELVDYCNAGYSVWSLRWRIRNEMFRRNRSGKRIRSTKHGAGHSMLVEKKRSNWWFYNYDQQLRNETHGYDVCRAAKMVGKYKRRRPKCNHRNYVIPRWGFNRGDPHISTLDGGVYTFNGQCEYYMLRNSSEEFQLLELLARTSLAKSSRPEVPSRATVFTGFALKAGNNNGSISVLFNESSDDIDVFSNSELLGSVRVDFFGRENATEVENYSLQSNDNVSITISESDTGFTLTVTKSLNFLQAAVQLDQDKHAGGVEGLMGNFNGNNTDDYKMRNGTLLPANSSERDLFEFGQSWRVLLSDDNHFPFNESFCNLTFLPVFVEDYRDNLLGLFSGNATLMVAANTTCQNPTESIYLSCMYDAGQLQSLAAADEAVLQVQQEVSAKAVASNTPPEFHMPENITITADTTFNITVNYTDAEGNAMTLTLDEPIDNSSTSVELIGDLLVWQVGQLNDSVNLSVVATDSIGAPSSWQPVVLYCHCKNGGVCSFDYATSESAAGETFYRAQCECPDGYLGDSCEIQPCDARPNPCYNESMCNMMSNGSYACDPCPDGLKGDGKICEDTDECLETPGICQENCTNTVPGYECSCSTPGYKVSPTNSSLCVDIDECNEGGHNCRSDQNQTCVNTPGSFSCSCSRTGYRANALNECKDIDECRELSNACTGSEVCINTDGSYFCECEFGLVRQAGACKAVVIDSGSAPPDTNDQTIVIVSSVIGGVVVVAVAIGIVAACLRSRPPVGGV